MLETLNLKTVSSKVKRSPKWHGRIPATVLLDPFLDDLAVRVFGIMALKTFQGSVSYIGMRLLAEITNSSPATISRRIATLTERGHIEVQKAGDGKRNHYVLVSPVFAQKQRDGVREIAPGPSGGNRLVSAPRRKTA